MTQVPKSSRGTTRTDREKNPNLPEKTTNIEKKGKTEENPPEFIEYWVLCCRGRFAYKNNATSERAIDYSV